MTDQYNPGRYLTCFSFSYFEAIEKLMECCISFSYIAYGMPHKCRELFITVSKMEVNVCLRYWAVCRRCHWFVQHGLNLQSDTGVCGKIYFFCLLTISVILNLVQVQTECSQISCLDCSELLWCVNVEMYINKDAHATSKPPVETCQCLSLVRKD